MASVRSIEKAWISYQNRQIFLLLKHAMRAAESSMASEILQRVCPREASLLNDPCTQAKVRLRFGGASFPPMIYFKVFLCNKNGEGIKYMTGRRMIRPYPLAVQSACSMMGARTFLNQLAIDTIQHRTHGFTDEIDVSTLKDYMKYASVLDETPACLGGRENSWRLLTLENLPRHVMFYDVVEFVYSHKMSPALCRELPKLLVPPVNHSVHMEHIRILSQYRTVPDCPTPTVYKSSKYLSSVYGGSSSQGTARRSKRARRRAVKMRTSYLHSDDTDSDSQTAADGGSHPMPSPLNTERLQRSRNDDVDDDVEACRLYEWTQNLSIDDCAMTPRVFSH